MLAIVHNRYYGNQYTTTDFLNIIYVFCSSTEIFSQSHYSQSCCDDHSLRGGGGWGGWELNAIVQNKSNLPHKQLNEFVPVAFLNDSG